MLRPTFLSIETARKSITAAQYGLDTTGHNMANQDTPGYSRQRVDQVSFGLYSNSRFSIYGKQLPGQGTLVTGINRIRDPFLDNRFRIEATNNAGLGVKNLALSDINAIFDEISLEEGGINDKFDQLVNAFANLGTGYNVSENQLVVRSESDQLALMINAFAKNLNGVESQQRDDFKIEINSLTEILNSIAYYNDKITQQHIYGNPANELMDERDLLIDKLSAMTDISVTYESVWVSDDRMVDKLIIKMKDSAQTTLIDGDKAAQFEYDEPSILNNYTYGLKIRGTDGKYQVDASGDPISVDDKFTRGTIRGFLDILNGKGNFADPSLSENSTRGIPYFRAAFNEFAKSFADQLNWVNADCPVDPTGKPLIPAPNAPGNLFTYDPAKAAETLSITDEWRGSLDMLKIYDSTGDPKNALKFLEAISTKKYNTTNGIDPTNQFVPGTFQEYLVSFMAEMASDLSLNTNMLKSSNNVIGGLMDNRDAVSGVSTNEEASNLMVYQNYYNAALRYMTVIDESLDQLINRMGTVGR